MREISNPSFLYKSSLAKALLSIIIVAAFHSSCKTQKQVQYFQGPIDTTSLAAIKVPEPIIQQGDLIGIQVFSDNANASAEFNGQVTSVTPESQSSAAGVNGITGSSGQNVPGYLVDQDGAIHLQAIGPLKVAGLTKRELSTLLTTELSKYLKNPYFSIRFLNYKFTVLGEVNRQGVYSIPGEHLTVIEALGMAGDLTMYGLKDSILVMREYGGRRTFGYLDVSKAEVVLSPFYYLKQNDVLIVKTNSKKPSAADQSTTRTLAIVATIATLLTTISVIVFNITR